MQAAPCLLHPPSALNATSLQQSTEKQHTYSCSRKLAALAHLEEFKPTHTLCFKSNTLVNSKWHTEFSVIALVRPYYPHLACIDLVSPFFLDSLLYALLSLLVFAILWVSVCITDLVPCLSLYRSSLLSFWGLLVLKRGNLTIYAWLWNLMQ